MKPEDEKLDISYSTRVRVEVEISLGQAWGAAWTAEEAHRVSIREAGNYLRDLQVREGGKIKLIGEPVVTHTIAGSKARR